ncbi:MULTISPECIES: hypothetical protein [Bartonella]|uniref:Uncharacterized protein n=1 Tax=Bartonella rochalimae ATCC BAA-1498 TaxID=685782 RepID=A0A067WNF0_9HYPH|nr:MULTISPECIES: hypothetical protein [Bartonella]AQX17916.1 hypothetical protein BA1379B_000650 [Bartonella sp. A1379B]AQX22429.1 hypothetical protein Bho11B_004030 [Bartonella sp. 11B]AQX24290.1 hypothetical protein Bho114_009750 [Bartonella sp. 114]AQX24877.1 hypothetical protein Bco22_001760 [Bartonella sp. Coyote22sub2]KEC57457.1 hypothetical protein O99_00105 [Bartonella rochalimae ATCC BAA-1498]
MNMKYFITVSSFTMMTAATVQGSDLKEEIPLISPTFRVSEWNKDPLLLKDSFGRVVYSKWEKMTEPVHVAFASSGSKKSKSKKKKKPETSNHKNKRPNLFKRSPFSF